MKHAAFFLPPRAMIFPLFLTPRAIWTQKEVKDWEGLFTTRKKYFRGVSRMSKQNRQGQAKFRVSRHLIPDPHSGSKQANSG
jgi:hypothetical protein